MRPRGSSTTRVPNCRLVLGFGCATGRSGASRSRAPGGIHHVGLEYCRVVLEGNFGELSGGDVDIGGDYFAVVYRAAF